MAPKRKTARKAKSKGDIAVPEDGNQSYWFHQGQFVMVAERSNKDRKSKLEAKWRGPYIIDEMVTDHRARVHELTLDKKKKKFRTKRSGRGGFRTGFQRISP